MNDNAQALTYTLNHRVPFAFTAAVDTFAAAAFAALASFAFATFVAFAVATAFVFVFGAHFACFTFGALFMSSAISSQGRLLTDAFARVSRWGGRGMGDGDGDVMVSGLSDRNSSNDVSSGRGVSGVVELPPRWAKSSGAVVTRCGRERCAVTASVGGTREGSTTSFVEVGVMVAATT
ncbi:hypothetical protein OF83DRAFT_287078 [Amylostereum chailletii]|nr:hypothetical protein OF83DRAFT_287078 [Amylostereum chailletii]